MHPLFLKRFHIFAGVKETTFGNLLTEPSALLEMGVLDAPLATGVDLSTMFLAFPFVIFKIGKEII